ncbi:MAG: FAD-dependent monooxygenase [Glaciecola sp.]|jgi:2-octaprenyl-6-methoxyphenol hydroxylase
MMQNDSSYFDFVVSGANTTGLLFALAILKRTPYSVALCDARDIVIEQQNVSEENENEFGADPRYVALAYNTVTFLASLDVDVTTLGPGIEQIHVSDRGQIGQTRLLANEVDVPALGYVVSLQALTQLLLGSLSKLSSIVGERLHILSETQLEHVTSLTDASPAKDCDGRSVEGDREAMTSSVHLALELSVSEGSTTMTCAQLVFADGQGSSLKTELGFTQTVVDFGQSGIVTTVTTNSSPYTRYREQVTAFERFTPQGPIALLPINPVSDTAHGQQNYSLVWCAHEDTKNEIMALDTPAFLQRLQHLFGHRAGHMVAHTETFSFPLKLTRHSGTHPYAVCLGNAAQALHPIAGQGFNLGVRDIQDAVFLLRTTSSLTRFGEDFAAVRHTDRTQTVLATSGLVSLFSNNALLLNALRSKGLSALHALPWVKRMFIRRAMGQK